MASEEASQLVILGNGFDLKLGLATKFEDYLNSFSIDDNIKKLNVLFNDLKEYSKAEIQQDPYNMSINDNLDNISEKISEIDKYIESIEKDNYQKKSLLEFYINTECNQIKLDLIPTLKRNNYYSRVYNQRAELLEQMIDKYYVNRNIQITFWDLYFLYLRDLKEPTVIFNWNDVELQILNFYTKKLYRQYGENVTNYEGFNLIVQSFKNNPVKWSYYEDEKLWLIIYTLHKSYNFTSNEIDRYLYQELIRFSQNFVDYLKSQYSQCYYGRNDYKLNSRWNFIDEKIAGSEKYELLNFNYTNAEGYGCIKQIHIHGNKDKHNEIPIIGINAEDLTSNKEHAFKLTKQYQLISSENNKVEKLDLENIKRIVFYGHSLALADYQYFRNIFDRISLAESSVQLVFKYSKGYENYDSIFRLLDRYSKDIDIDITTTLTLENRLKVEEISD